MEDNNFRRKLLPDAQLFWLQYCWHLPKTFASPTEIKMVHSSPHTHTHAIIAVGVLCCGCDFGCCCSLATMQHAIEPNKSAFRIWPEWIEKTNTETKLIKNYIKSTLRVALFGWFSCAANCIVMANDNVVDGGWMAIHVALCAYFDNWICRFLFCSEAVWRLKQFI